MVTCAHCGKATEKRPYELRSGKRLFCTSKCAARYRAVLGEMAAQAHRTPKEVIDEVRRLYTDTPMTAEAISAQTGVSRDVIFRQARLRRWPRFKRKTAVRTRYRKAAAEKIGRALRKHEHVHHVDGDIENNDPSNLTVFENAREHAACHGSLERAAFELFRAGLIAYSEKERRYYIVRSVAKAA